MCLCRNLSRTACPTETILFKTALWRPKDQADLSSLTRLGLPIDYNYLDKRLQEVRLGNRLHARLAGVLSSF